MRRIDRQITDKTELLEIIGRYKVFRIGMFSPDEGLYIVPLNYGYEFGTQGLILYFHCALSGYKVNILEKNNNICFEIDGGYVPIFSESPCKFSNAYESIIGWGKAEPILDLSEKKQAMGIITKRFMEGDFEFSDNNIKNVAVYRIIVSSFTGKRRNNL